MGDFALVSFICQELGLGWAVAAGLFFALLLLTGVYSATKIIEFIGE